MIYYGKYKSPMGDILVTCDGKNLTGVYFYSSRYFPVKKSEISFCDSNEIILKTKEWLDIYFSGKRPHFDLPYQVSGTDFQNRVWQIVSQIPYGKTVSYGDIAAQLSAENGSKRVSCQAVGNAVGKNKISIIIPCHRVVGAKGEMKGYAAGIDKKVKLLSLEKENSTED